MTRLASATAPDRGQRFPAPRRPPRQGVVLLEVVLAVGLFSGAALVLLTGLGACLRTADRVRLDAQATDLAVTLLSEVQMGLVPLVDDGPNDDEQEDLVDWSWEIAVSPLEENTEAPPLLQVEVIIRNDRADRTLRLVHLLADDEEAAESAAGPALFGPGGMR